MAQSFKRSTLVVVGAATLLMAAAWLVWTAGDPEGVRGRSGSDEATSAAPARNEQSANSTPQSLRPEPRSGAAGPASPVAEPARYQDRYPDVPEPAKGPAEAGEALYDDPELTAGDIASLLRRAEPEPPPNVIRRLQQESDILPSPEELEALRRETPELPSQEELDRLRAASLVEPTPEELEEARAAAGGEE